MARIGILTGGGATAPASTQSSGRSSARASRATTTSSSASSTGWAGVLAGEGRPLDINATRGILPRGGTILGTSRTNLFKDDGPGVEGVLAQHGAGGVEMLIPIGGEDTLGVASTVRRGRLYPLSSAS